jgi:hypothetical protein
MREAKVTVTVAAQVLDDTAERDVLEALTGALLAADLTLPGAGLALSWVQIDHYEEV